MIKRPLISIIAPVKNEKGNLEWTVNEIFKYVKPRFELLIVYDDPKDNTLPEALRLLQIHKNIRLIKNNYGKGVLNAIKKGFDLSKGDVLVMMAVDRTDDPKTINRMYIKIQNGFDLICPTRYSIGGKVIGKITIKSMLSKLSGITTPHLLGIPTSDLTYSYKMFKKIVIRSIPINSKGGFEFAEELVIKAYLKGYKICEVPTVWRDRSYGKSKFELIKWLPKYIYWYLFGIVGRIKLITLKLLNRQKNHP